MNGGDEGRARHACAHWRLWALALLFSVALQVPGEAADCGVTQVAVPFDRDSRALTALGEARLDAAINKAHACDVYSVRVVGANNERLAAAANDVFRATTALTLRWALIRRGIASGAVRVDPNAESVTKSKRNDLEGTVSITLR